MINLKNAEANCYSKSQNEEKIDKFFEGVEKGVYQWDDNTVIITF